MKSLAAATLLRKTDAQVSTDLQGETIILQLESGNYFSLNEVGVVVWRELDQPRTVAQLCAKVLAEYEVDEAECARDVGALIERLIAEHMLEVAGPP